MVEPGFCFSPTTFVPSRLRVRKRTGPTSRAKRLTPRRQDAKGEDEEGGERKNGRTWVFLLPKNLSAFAPSRLRVRQRTGPTWRGKRRREW
jgi:hypothetical protein